MSAWPKYGHRSFEGYRPPHLCSYSWPPYVYGLTPWVVLFSDDLLCLRSWHRTNQWHDSLLPRDPLWLTCWFLLANLSDLPVSMFCCWWISLLFCAPLVSFRIRKEANCMNRDAGAYNLPTTYDRILVTRSSSTSRDHAWWSSPLANETSQLGTHILRLVVL